MAAGSAAPAVAVRVWPLKGASEVAAALGRAPALRLLRHPHVAPLLDCLRGRHFGIVTVAESGTPLRARLARLAASGDEAWLARVLRDVLLGLAFLHARRLAHRALCLDAVEFDGDGRARLADAWVGELCNGGHGAAFALGHPAYAPPEALLLPARPSPAHAHTHAPAADVWAVGVLASELLSVASLTPATPAAALRALAAAPEAATVRAGASEALQDLVRACLAPLASDRPSVFQLLHHPLFAPLPRPLAPSRWQQRPALRCLSLLEPAAPPTPDAGRRAAADAASSELADAYALWRAAGADPERELLAAQPPSPPVLRLPSLVLLAAAPAHRPAALRDDPRPFLLSLADLRRRPSLPPPTSSAASASATTPTVPRSLSSSSASTPSLTSSASSAPLTTPAPVSPRTLGSATAARVKQLRELLAALPASLPRLALELRAADVPAALRPELWAALLGVSTAEAATAYAAVDKEAEGAADRQIEVDIPRCHQYNELLASPEGQRKLKRVLKAWVARHAGQLVYWQGLDSLLAPLLTVFYPSEALAYAGLVRVVAKYCREFFRPDNSGPMQEHLLRFRQLLAYHDPALATHLQSVGFSPDLYAIPWFLTLFSHLLPLDKLYLLWDSLLAGSPALPFFVALAVLREMRTTLLPLDFNACILFFSHLPELDVRELLRQAALYEERTPPSAVVPFAPPPALPGAAAPLPLDERLNEWAPRIAPTEALRLRHALLVDLRRAKEFEAEHVVGAVPINHRNPSIAQFDAYRGRPMLLVADARGRQAAELARQLVEAGHAEVALVHGGHDALRAVAGVRLEGAGVGSGV